MLRPSATLSVLLITALFLAASCGTSSAPADGGPLLGTLDFDVKFRPTGFATSVDCATGLVTTVRFQVREQAPPNMVRTEVSRPCIASERYRVSFAPGTYIIKVQGLNGAQTICYESDVIQTVVAGNTDMLSLVSEQHPTGAAGGCQYPSSPP